MEDPKHAALRMGNETKAPNTPVLIKKVKLGKLKKANSRDPNGFRSSHRRRWVDSVKKTRCVYRSRGCVEKRTADREDAWRNAQKEGEVISVPRDQNRKKRTTLKKNPPPIWRRPPDGSRTDSERRS